LDSRVEEILKFWFGASNADGVSSPREIWFRSTPEFDEEIRRRFLPAYEDAAADQLDVWMSSPRGCLALIILLDQFSRNLFRDDNRAFAADPVALKAAQYAIDHGLDRELQPLERVFVYLPFEHSENIELQNRSVELFSQLPQDDTFAGYLDYAVRHRRVIQRFGRFPHRNADLGRQSTPEELEFLAGPEAPF
jgi:uncharacterized protein (DUF924 family)